MRPSRIPLLALPLLAACGQAASNSLPEPSVLPTVEGDVDAGSPIGDESLSPVSPEDHYQLIGQAVYYLPVYRGQAGEVSGLDNREELAASALEMWKEIYGGNESLQPGEVDPADLIASLSEDPTISDDQAATIDDEVADAIEDMGINYEQFIAGRAFSPIFSELAELCGDPSALGIFATGSESPPAVLTQYENVKPAVAAKMPEGILQAWYFAGKEVVTYVIQYTTAPEVVAVVSIFDSGCSLEEVASQVKIEKRLAD